MIHIKIPATSANMGSGFDCIGTALELYNHIWVSKRPKGSGFLIETKKTQALDIPTDETNLIYTTMQYFYKQKNLPMPDIHIIQEDNIPMARGLGSSAACIVGGLMAGNILEGDIASKEELFQMANALEGHPDNVAPAIFGNLVTSVQTETDLRSITIPLSADLIFATMIPDFPLETKEARAVLPDSYTRSDMVFNASRTALLIASLYTKQFENLEIAMDDKIHQPYRSQLIPHMADIFEKAKEYGAIACYLSGAGPTLMAIITKDKQQSFETNMNDFLSTLENVWELLLLKPDTTGIKINIESMEDN